MNDEKYIGLDVHQATISVAVMDATGKVVMALAQLTVERRQEVGPVIRVLPHVLKGETKDRYCKNVKASTVFLSGGNDEIKKITQRKK